AIGPSGRPIPLELSQRDINPGDTAEFKLCMTAAGGGPDRFVLLIGGHRLEVDAESAELGQFLDGGELVYPMEDLVEVQVRLTSKEGAILRDTLQLSRVGCLDLDLPRWSEV